VHAAVSARAFHFILEELSPLHQGEERVAELEVQRRKRLRPNQIYVSANSSGILLALIVVGSVAPPLVRPFCPSRTRR